MDIFFGFCTFHILDICEITLHMSVIVVTQSETTISLVDIGYSVVLFYMLVSD